MSTLGQILRQLRDDPVRFNQAVLGRVHPSIPQGYWAKQIEVAESFYKYPVTLVPSGHGVGKTYLAAGLALHYLLTRPNSIVVCYAPSNKQLLNTLWPEIKKAWLTARIELPGRIINGPSPRIEIGPKWFLQCLSADTDPDRLQGIHSSNFAVICDESSWNGYNDVLAAIDSQNPERKLLIGNPTSRGSFYHKCKTADGIMANVIPISSLDGPHIGMDRSPVGLADATWLATIRLDYGEDGPYWRIRVLGQWPDEDQHVLIPESWLSRCLQPHVLAPIETRWLSTDLSAGTGQGDLCVIMVRDRNGVLHMDWSSSWDYPQGVAERIMIKVDQYQIPLDHIVYDKTGVGAAFSYALTKMNPKVNPKGYMGATGGGRVATSMRGACAWACRQRLDPVRHPTHFHIPSKYLELLRTELRELRYEIANQGMIKLENKMDMHKRLGKSPDRLDSLFQSFAFDHMEPEQQPEAIPLHKLPPSEWIKAQVTKLR